MADRKKFDQGNFIFDEVSKKVVSQILLQFFYLPNMLLTYVVLSYKIYLIHKLNKCIIYECISSQWFSLIVNVL